jgi:LysR substrate binding domain
LLADVDEALDVVATAGRGETGELTVGLLATASLDFTPRLLRAFAEELPEVAVSVRNFSFDDPSGGMRSGQADGWIDDLDPVARDFWTLGDRREGRPPRIGAHITGFDDLFAAVRAGRVVAASPASVVTVLPSRIWSPARSAIWSQPGSRCAAARTS